MDGLPYVTKIKRKPQGIGCEMKCALDALSGIMLVLELQKGAVAQRERK